MNENFAEIFYEFEKLIPTVRFGVEIETGIPYYEVYDEEEYYDDDYDEYYSDGEYTDFAYDIADAVKTKVDYIYEDGSCGTEIPTGVYKSPRKFRKDLKELRKTFSYYGYDYERKLSPYTGAGGHFNVSFRQFYERARDINNSLKPYIPLLIYMFGHNETYERNPRYRFMRRCYEDDDYYIREKYHWLHRKGYALEFRFPDSPAKINYSTVLYYTLIGLCLTASQKKVNDLAVCVMEHEIFDKIYAKLYYKLIDSDYGSIDDFDEEILYSTLMFMLEYIEEYIQYLWDAYGIDLMGAILYCFDNPSYKRRGDIPDDVFRYFFGDYDIANAGIERTIFGNEIYCEEVW